MSEESVRRHLTLAMEAAHSSLPMTQNISTTQESLDSLDLAMRQMEEIAHANSGNTTSPSNTNDNPDPESHYTASPPTQREQDKNATPSPGRGSPS